MKDARKDDSHEMGKAGVARGDESGTGPDPIAHAVADCRLLGLDDLFEAIAKADAEMQEHKKWIFSKEPILYLGIIVKGSAGVQVQGPINLTRFSGKVDPKYADGIMEIVRLNADGECQNTLLRCSLHELGPKGITIYEEYKDIGQSLIGEIIPNTLGGFDIDVSVSSQTFEDGIYDDRLTVTKGKVGVAKVARGRGAVAGGNNFAFLDWISNATPALSLAHYGAGLVAACLIGLLVFQSVYSHTPNTKNGFAQQSAATRKARVVTPIVVATGSSTEETPGMIKELGLLATVRIIANPSEEKRQGRAAADDRIMLLLAPETKDKKMSLDTQSAAVTSFLHAHGFTVLNDQEKRPSGVYALVTLNGKFNSTNQSKAVFVRVLDAADGSLFKNESPALAMTNQQKAEALRLYSIYLDSVPLDRGTTKEESAQAATHADSPEANHPNRVGQAF